MANQNASRVTVPLDGGLCMNRHDADVRQFAGFNGKNAQVYGGVLSPFWKREDESTNALYDADGNRYEIAEGDYGFPTLYVTDAGGTRRLIRRFNSLSGTDDNMRFERRTFDFKSVDCIDIDLDGNGDGMAIKGFMERGTDGSTFRFALDAVSAGNLSDGANAGKKVGSFDISGVPLFHAVRHFPGMAYPWVAVSVSAEYYSGGSRDVHVVRLWYSDGSSSYTASYNDGSFSGSDEYTLSPVRSSASSVSSRYLLLNNGGRTYLVDTDAGTAASKKIRVVTKAVPSNASDASDIWNVMDGSFVINEYGHFVTFRGGIKNSNFSVSAVNDGESSYEAKLTLSPMTMQDNASLGDRIAAHRVQNYSRAFAWKTASVTVDGVAYKKIEGLFSDNSLSGTWYGGAFSPSAEEGKYCANYNTRALFPNGANFCTLINTYAPDPQPHITGISYAADGAMLGTLLSDWNGVDEDFLIGCSDGAIVYRTNGGEVVLVTTPAGVGGMRLVEGRYVVINTTAYHNCYDTKKKELTHYAGDFNGRVSNIYSQSKLWSSDGATLLDKDAGDTALSYYACGINAGFELGGGFTSWQGAPALIYARGVDDGGSGSLAAVGCMGETVDVYHGDTAAAYRCSVTELRYVVAGTTAKVEKLIKSVSAALEGTTYSVDTNANVIYTPSMFAEFVDSHMNRDMVLVGDTAYPLMYSGAEPVMAYQMLSMLERVDALFVIQGVQYAVRGGYVISLSYSDGVIASTETVAEARNMTYVGADTKRALFYCGMNRSLYAFTGDNVLAKVQECDRITAVTGALFNPVTQELYVSATDEAAGGATAGCLYVFGADGGQCRIDGVGACTELYVTSGFAALKHSGGLLLLSHNALDGFERMPVSLRTGYYGAGDNVVSVIDCWYIRLYNQNRAESGTLTLSVRTVTDKGAEQERRTVQIKASDWDRLTNTYFVRFQPKLQRGVGVQLELESDFAVAQLCLDYKPDTQQVSRANV